MYQKPSSASKLLGALRCAPLRCWTTADVRQRWAMLSGSIQLVSRTKTSLLCLWNSLNRSKQHDTFCRGLLRAHGRRRTSVCLPTNCTSGTYPTVFNSLPVVQAQSRDEQKASPLLSCGNAARSRSAPRQPLAARRPSRHQPRPSFSRRRQ